MYNLITILGPTASGKTSLAVNLAISYNAEIISADSRQVYQLLDIGSGKDLSEYSTGEQSVPYHLIDIHPVTYEYNLFDFQQDAYAAIENIWFRKRLPILCGGTGMYLQSVLQHYDLRPVPEDKDFRRSLDNNSEEELISLLKEYKSLHNKTDIEDRKRLTRALEIARYQDENPAPQPLAISPVVFGIHFERQELKNRITSRLKQRFESGMIDEVDNLLKSGTDPEKLILLGLEYRLITQYLQGEIKSYNDLFQKLNSAIHAFAKRQMTWFRKMEKDGTIIHWIDGLMPTSEKISFIRHVLRNA